MKTLPALLLIVACCVPIRAEALAPGDFAAGLPLPEAREGGVYSLTLPLAVYDKVTRPDLGDLRVFNGAGEAVAHAIRKAETRPEQQESRQTLPFFPLRCEPETQIGDISLRVNRSTAGTIINVDAGGEQHQQSPASCVLIDASQVLTAPTALELDWEREGDANALFPVTLTQSTDLTHWSPFGFKTVLADLRHNGQAIAARRITMHGKPLPYVRLDCVDCREPLRLRGVTAVFGSPVEVPEHGWLQPESPRIGKEGSEMVFEYAAVPAITVTGLRVQLPEANSLARVAIESRPGDEAPWRSRYTGLIYDLNLEGKRLTSEPAACAATTDRHWRVRILHDGAGLGEQRPPRLELGWLGDQLLFVARGQGPYTLAFGSSKVQAETSPPDNLILAAMRDARSESLIRPIEPGPMQILGGEEARKPHLSSAFWKKLLLWAVLIGGVLLLALMTRTIAREMKLR